MGRGRKNSAKKSIGFGNKAKEADKPLVPVEDFCCNIHYAYRPTSLKCYAGSPLCGILPNASFYAYEEICVCESCFNDDTSDGVSVKKDKKFVILKKNVFVKKVNNETVEEPIVSCADCGSKFHQICVLHLPEIWKRFLCDDCLKSYGWARTNQCTPSNLPQTQLSDHIEKKLESFIAQQLQQTEKVWVRVLASTKSNLNVKNNFRKKYGLPDTLPYQSKVIFVFQQIEFSDVAIFAFMVQEYGADCPPPNQGRVYLSYVDSVNFFRPRELRTALYQEILLAYFEYAKLSGFKYAHIWVCPPGPLTSGNDYLFYCHPPEQKIPTFTRLKTWYKTLMEMGKSRGIIIQHQTLISYMADNEVECAKDIPYFDGDHWPEIIESKIEEEESAILVSLPPKKRKVATKKWKKGNKKVQELMSAEKTDPVIKLLLPTLFDLKDMFLVAKLNDETVGLTNLQENIPCEIMENRDVFMQMAQDNYLEFSMLRRAKFSTLSIIQKICVSQSGKKVATKPSLNMTICVPEITVTAQRTKANDATGFLKSMQHAMFCTSRRSCGRDNCKTAKQLFQHLKMCDRDRQFCKLCTKVMDRLLIHTGQCLPVGGCDILQCRLFFTSLHQANLGFRSENQSLAVYDGQSQMNPD